MQKCFCVVLPLIISCWRWWPQFWFYAWIHKPNDFWDLHSSWLPTGACKALWKFDVQLGWPHIRCHSRLCEWEGFEADFRILVSSEESSRGYLYFQKRGKHLGQDFAVSPHKFTEAIKFLTALFWLPLSSVHRVFPLWSFHSFCTAQMKYKHPEGNAQVPARAVPFSRADSRGHWALLCCSWKIKLCLGAHESLWTIKK